MWDALEADFLRDYGIVLTEQIDKMSWRMFGVLYRNLSPYGATASRIEELRRHPDPEEEVDEDEGRRQAAAFFGGLISTAR